jgi:hypothetical protein
MLADPICLIKWEENHRMQSRILLRCGRDGFNARRVAGRREKLQQAVARDRRRRGIHQRMKIKRLMRQQRRVEHDAHAALLVIDRREWRDRAGQDTEHLLHQLGRAERKPARGAELAMQRTQFDWRIFGRNDKVGRALLVAQKQILGMAAGDGAAQLARFLDREHRRMGNGLVRDPERVQIGEKFIRRGGHRPLDSAGWVRLQSYALFGIALMRRRPEVPMTALPFSDAGVAQG